MKAYLPQSLLGTPPSTAPPPHTVKRKAQQAVSVVTSPPPKPQCQLMPMTPAQLQDPIWTAPGEAYAPLRTTAPNQTVARLPQAGLPARFLPMGVQPYWWNCGSTVSVAWVPIATARPSTPAPSPVIRPGQLSQQQVQVLAASITPPAMQININPSAAGITNLTSYFWITGYDGKPAYQPGTAAGPGGGNVELRLTPELYVWSFGDGTALSTGSIGQPYPQHLSDIAHTYTVRSDWSPYASGGAYTVNVTAYFDVAFQVEAPGQTLVPNGTWVDFSAYGMPPLLGTAHQSYKVNEVVSALVN